MSNNEFYVIKVDGQPVGPLSGGEISQLVAAWEIGPSSLIRAGKDGEWSEFREVALGLGIDLPEQWEWERNKEAAIGEARRQAIGCAAVAAVVVWAGLSMLGLGFLFMPLMMWTLAYVVIALAFGAVAKVDVLGAPAWLDVRKKPEKGGVLQFVAMSVAMLLVGGYYIWRIME